MEGDAISGQRRTGVTLEEILEARDRRVERQAYLTASYKTPLISFTLNIPGDVKRTPLSSYFFHDRLKRLRTQLLALGVVIEEEIVTSALTGDEAILAVSRLSARALKMLAVAIEERSAAGRLMDLDVIDEGGKHVKRSAIGARPRLCFLCEQPASVCSSSRAHHVSELTDHVKRLLDRAVSYSLADEVVALASKASSYELMVSMKPGLVSCTDSGSHADMDRFTFAESQASLLTYYRDAFLAGWKRCDDGERALCLRLVGMQAEQQMLQATGGVNTHRGWIYMAGILLAAVGMIGVSSFRERAEHPHKAATMLSEAAASIAHTLEDSLETVLFEHVRQGMADHRIYAPSVISMSRTRIHGVREEAVSGFPSIFQVGLPLLSRALTRGESPNLAGQRAVLALLASTEDTTLGKRGGAETVQYVRKHILSALNLECELDNDRLILKALELSEEELHAHLETLSAFFLERRLSCGGVADLLAGSYLTLDLCLLIERLSEYI